MRDRFTRDDIKLGFFDSGELPSYESIYEKVKEYEQKLADGRLVELPCKVGDTVWSTDDCMEDFIPWFLDFDYWMIPQIGKTVFLTMEEAEKALKEGLEDKNVISKD